MSSQSLYEILQVRPDASPEVIKAAYKSLAAKYHPDRDSTPEAARQFAEIQKAYEILSDPGRRRAYDASVDAGRTGDTKSRSAFDVVMRVDGSNTFLTVDEHFRRGWQESAGCDFSNHDFTGMSFKHAMLQNAKLDGSIFIKCDFSQADLRNCSAQKARFDGADFSTAKLAGVEFTGANLAGANLRKRDLRRAIFASTNLFGTQMQGCDITDVDLSSSHLVNAALEGVTISDGTKFPDGYGIPKNVRNISEEERQQNENFRTFLKVLFFLLFVVIAFIVIILVAQRNAPSVRTSVGTLTNLEATSATSTIAASGDSAVASNILTRNVGETVETSGTPSAVVSATPELLKNSVGLTLSLIPAGEFLMGSPDHAYGRHVDEGPQQHVKISVPFYIGITEVTQGQWLRVMQSKPSMSEAHVREGLDFPVVNVSWNEAVEFCRKLSEVEGNSYRLPTEAEWEYACRGGTNTAYSFGDSPEMLRNFAWYDFNTAGEMYAHKVGTKLPNSYGLYDMHGNVREWCSYWSENPKGPTNPYTWLFRGGSWYEGPVNCRSAFRGRGYLSKQNSYTGFRIVRPCVSR
jgi:formylglycine-generating enzyme required for sulfatase activity/curved DNA-binding protein CbpA